MSDAGDVQANDQANRRKMSRAEAGRKGGNKTRERHGSDFFRKIGKVGGLKGRSGVRRDRDEVKRSQ